MEYLVSYKIHTQTGTVPVRVESGSGADEIIKAVKKRLQEIIGKDPQIKIDFKIHQ